jgi:hypothetical protein
MVRIVLAALVLAACGSAQEPLGPSFGASLRSSNEVVRPQTTTGSGTASLGVRGIVVSYGISALNLSGVGTGALHLGAAGSEGPALVSQLFVQDPTTPRSRSRGSFQQGDIQPATPGGAPMTVAELVAQMRAGNVYVNVTTDENPGGEIRGQLALTAEAPSQ